MEHMREVHVNVTSVSRERFEADCGCIFNTEQEAKEHEKLIETNKNVQHGILSSECTVAGITLLFERIDDDNGKIIKVTGSQFCDTRRVDISASLHKICYILRNYELVESKITTQDKLIKLVKKWIPGIEKGE